MKRTLVLVSVVALLISAVLAMTIRSSSASSEIMQDGPSTEPANPAPAVVSEFAGHIFSYQGQLTNAAGNPITNASLAMTFRLYTTLTGGTACWSESQNVNVQNGQFNVLLGRTTAIQKTCLSGDTYLEITVGTETLTPRELLASVASAAKADTLTSGAITQSDLTVNGALSVVNNLYAESAITSPGGRDLTIDAGWGSSNSVILKDNVNIQGYLDVQGPDITLAYTPRGDGGRAIVHDSNDVLTLNYGNDFSGGTRIQSSLSVWGPGSIAGDLNVDGPNLYLAENVVLRNDGRTLYLVPWAGPGYRWDQVVVGGGGGTKADVIVTGRVSAAGLDVGSCHISTGSESDPREQASCTGGTITSGAYVEANLMTNEERAAETVERFEQGDLLCWSADDQQLQLCAQENDRLVMAVADADGKPIVLGAEPVKVIGPVVAGDLLVASDVLGHAMVNNDPLPGTVIGQALQNLDGESGMIKAMIRKW